MKTSFKHSHGFTFNAKARGFTLIELLVVIAIIAILSSIGLSTYFLAQKNARDGKRIADLDEVQKALEQYYSLNQRYPAETSYPSDINSYFANTAAPKDPSTGANYTYRDCSTSTNRYNLCTTLESCGSKCNLSSMPTQNNGCTAAPVQSAGNTILCKSNISTN